MIYQVTVPRRHEPTDRVFEVPEAGLEPATFRL
jgi:hypothetical protein